MALVVVEPQSVARMTLILLGSMGFTVVLEIENRKLENQKAAAQHTAVQSEIAKTKLPQHSVSKR